MGEKAGEEKLLPLWEHVNELANLLRSWIYTFIIATVAFMVLPADLSFLKDPLTFYRPFVSVVLLTIKTSLLPPDVVLISGSFTAPIELYVISSVVLGFAVSTPMLAYKIYRFVDPALRTEERRSVYPFVTTFSLLFAAGIIFGFFVLLPFVVSGTLLFLPIVGASPFANIEDFYSLVFFTLLMTGFSFTLPVFIIILVKFQVIATDMLTKRRLYIWIGAFVLTAIVTPDGGPIADVALFAPIILLLEGSILVGKRYEKNRDPQKKKKEQPRPVLFTCNFCGGPIDPGGVFCGRCGKSRA